MRIRVKWATAANKPVDSKAAAAVVACAGLAAIVYVTASVDLAKFQWNWQTLVLTVLLLLVLLGFVFVAYGARWAAITSEKTDQKIAETYHRLLRASRPLWWLLLIAWAVYMAYLAWELYRELGGRF